MERVGELFPPLKARRAYVSCRSSLPLLHLARWRQNKLV